MINKIAVFIVILGLFLLACKRPVDGNISAVVSDNDLVLSVYDSEKAYGVHTNPNKSEKVTFSAEDKIIVIAEE